MTDDQAEELAKQEFGDVITTKDYADRHQIFINDKGEWLLLGTGGDWEECFEMAHPTFDRFYRAASTKNT